jgi:hypothetical protein
LPTWAESPVKSMEVMSAATVRESGSGIRLSLEVGCSELAGGML